MAKTMAHSHDLRVLNVRGFHKSRRRDLNPQPPLYESETGTFHHHASTSQALRAQSACDVSCFRHHIPLKPIFQAIGRSLVLERRSWAGDWIPSAMMISFHFMPQLLPGNPATTRIPGRKPAAADPAGDTAVGCIAGVCCRAASRLTGQRKEGPLSLPLPYR